ncbi:hypothetical protein RRG08_064648 [Elysia crispata]|uniref:Uncharacterized protein n=1 Tax=Elysia crispata TaxID=231223 RepID=A0AAE1B9J2_9GAST|nr:hypothetical protein RRG08_064648 [Elysia crispata]
MYSPLNPSVCIGCIGILRFVAQRLFAVFYPAPVVCSLRRTMLSSGLNRPSDHCSLFALRACANIGVTWRNYPHQPQPHVAFNGEIGKGPRNRIA